MPIGTGNAQGQIVLDERYVDRTLDAVEIAVAVGSIGETAKFVEIGPDIGDVQRTGRGVATEQCALRAAQHFDALDVDEFGKRNARAGLISAINEDADSRFKTDIVGGRTDAANSQHHRTGRQLGVRGREAGRHVGDLADADNALAFELYRADRGHGERNGLHVLGAAGGRHDDDIFVERFGFLLGVLRKSGGSHGGCTKCRHEDLVDGFH